MRLPKRTAECGIGPARGFYTTGAVVSPDRRSLALMAVGDRGSGDFTVAMEACQPPDNLCWGEPGSPHANDWVCCDQSQNCAYGANGAPGCGPLMVPHVLMLNA